MLYNLNIDHPYEYLLKVWQDVLEDTGPIKDKLLTIRKAEVADSLMLDIRDEQADTFNNKDIDLMVRTHAFLSMLSPMNYALFYGDDLLMLMNIVVVIGGVAEISFLTDKNFTCSSFAVRLAMIKAFKKALDELPFKRIQAKVNSEFTIGKNFVEKLGFKKEGVMRKFGPNNTDYIMYSLIREDGE